MSLPRYPEYRDSGVEWLGEVPAHWGVAPLKRGFEVRLGKMLQPARSNDGDVLAPYLRAANIQWKGVDLEDVKSMWFSARERDLLCLKHGDLLVSEGGDVGRSALWREEAAACYFQNSVNRVRARGEDRTDYLYYWMATIKAKGYVDVLCNKSTIAHFTAEKVEAVPAPYPKPEEQRRIAAFLNRETTRIDALIAEQEKLLALLAEKRQATISHAVTRGLDPNVQMKGSGIPWLGEVPAHWEIAPLKWMVDPSRPIMYGIVLPGPDVGEGIPILKGGNVKPSRMNLDSMARTTAEIEAPYARARLKAGDLVYAIRGTIGDCEMVPDEMESANITQDVARVAVAETEVPSWIRWALLSAPVREALAVGSLGAAVRGVNIFDLKRVKVPKPPVEEQREIAAFLDSRTAEFDGLSQAAAGAVGLLRERRSALISAAVTGQIDVRGLVAREAA